MTFRGSEWMPNWGERWKNRIADLEAENARLRTQRDDMATEASRLTVERDYLVQEVNRLQTALEEVEREPKPVCRSPVHCLCVYAAASRVGSIEYWWKEMKRERDGYKALAKRLEVGLDKVAKVIVDCPRCSELAALIFPSAADDPPDDHAALVAMPEALKRED